MAPSLLFDDSAPTVPGASALGAFSRLFEIAPSGVELGEQCVAALSAVATGEPVRLRIPTPNQSVRFGASADRAGVDCLHFTVGPNTGTVSSTPLGAEQLRASSGVLESLLSALWIGQAPLFQRSRELADLRAVSVRMDRLVRGLAALTTLATYEEQIADVVAAAFGLRWAAYYRSGRDARSRGYDARAHHTTDGSALPPGLDRQIIDLAFPAGSTAFLTAANPDHAALFPSQARVVGFLDPDRARGDHLGLLLLGERGSGDGWQPAELALVDTALVLLSSTLQRLIELRDFEAKATTDALTQLGNRRFFDTTLEAEVRRALRYGQSVGLLLFDIDHFKKFNDTYGHETGDVVLRETAQVLRGMLREVDYACRYGGEELAVILPNTDSASALLVADRLRRGIEAHAVAGPAQEALKVTVSVGVAACPAHSRRGEVLKALSDKALYEAKRLGRNQAVLATLDDGPRA